ncbi:2-keto-4-methylthiobutyrate aminotransferase apoenzyme [bacterium A37T11]|nr:2-keto-4-methylthiobutyrate aminotransferase apoenzyme [bacterium A37T11]
MHSKLPHVGTTIFTVMTQLAARHEAINLSQGFPDYDCPPQLVSLVNQHMQGGRNQYAPMSGVQHLREQISAKVFDLYEVDYHPDTEITVTAGGTQALFTAIGTLIRPGDEVIIFEPAYDSYAPSVEVFGGIVKAVSLQAPDFSINWNEVQSLVTEKTRLIIINTPNNPTSRVFTDADFQKLIRLTQGTNIYLLSDEVYEHIVFDGLSHRSALQYPELRERSLIVASFGKLYHITGWKVGYTLAPASLTAEFRKVHQYNVFSVNTPVQYALADFLRDKDFYLQLGEFFQQKRDYLLKGLSETLFKPLTCDGTYFLLANYSAISEMKEADFCQDLTIRYGVATIPVAAFYKEETNQQVIRICFAKKQETLEAALEKLLTVAL